MKLLVTGGCGFLGSNLAAHAIGRGDEVMIFDSMHRMDPESNRAWLSTLGAFTPDAVFHLTGQVAMTTSIINPRRDFEVNATGSFNVLESVRTHCPEAPVLYSSTNKVYGDLECVNYTETDTRYTPDGYPGASRKTFPSPFPRHTALPRALPTNTCWTGPRPSA